MSHLSSLSSKQSFGGPLRLFLILLIFYSTGSFASLPYIPARELYDLADLVFVGTLIKLENESEETRSALLKNLLTIKGEFTQEVRLCNQDFQEKLGIQTIGVDKQVYFFRKKNNCYVGALGYKSRIYIKKDTNCIWAEFAYPFDDSKDKLEPLEVFVNKLVGNESVSIPGSLKAEKCEPLFQG
jgi:hypothetical protein